MRVALIDRSGLRRSGVVSRVDRRGRYRLRLRRQAPGHVRPILLASSGHPVACGMPVLLRVRAGIRLLVTPRRLRNGQTVTLRGRVGGIRSAGTRVMLQARAEGAPVWTTVTVLQSRVNGSFAFRYRFRRTFARTTYVFRAVSPRQRGHAYLRGSSAVQRVVVGP